MEPCRVPQPALGSVSMRMLLLGSMGQWGTAATAIKHTCPLTSRSSPRTPKHRHGAAAVDGQGGRAGKSQACILMPGLRRGHWCSGRCESSPGHSPPPQTHTSLSSPCFNWQSLGGGSGGEREPALRQWVGREGSKGLGWPSCLLRTCRTAWWRAHSSKLSGLVPPHGRTRALLLPPEHGLSERPSSHNAAPCLPHNGLEEADGDEGGTGGTEPVQAA